MQSGTKLESKDASRLSSGVIVAKNRDETYSVELQCGTRISLRKRAIMRLFIPKEVICLISYWDRKLRVFAYEDRRQAPSRRRKL